MAKKKITSNTMSMNNHIVADFQKLITKYQENEAICNYSRRTVMLDLIYFLAISIDPEEFKYHDGFEKFKKHLKEDIL